MRVLHYPLAGKPRPVYVPKSEDDLAGFWDFIARPRRALAVDTETTGLQVFSHSFRVRLVQFGDTEEAWVLDAARFPGAIREALERTPTFVFHNATYDLLALNRQGLADLDDLYPRSFDTYTIAHLLDPRPKHKGGVGHGLKALSNAYVDPAADDGQKVLHAAFHEMGETKDTGWAVIPLDHPDYLRYAGSDVLLTARLFDAIGPELKARGLVRLYEFERAVAIICARMERRGIRLDAHYAEKELIPYLVAEEEAGVADARRWGIKNVNSGKQVADALIAAGATLTEKTDSGKNWKTDKKILEALVKIDGNECAASVMRAKQAGKFRKSYVEASLNLRDPYGRVHPNIRPLQARTARMAVATPPLQQLPSGDWRIRRMFLADPGHVIVAADYRQVEMRVLAALAKDRAMLRAIAEGQDIHDAVATVMYGADFAPAQRKIAKNTGFGEVFGGGAKTLARQAGVPLSVARDAKALFADGFPGIKRYGRKLMERAEWGKRQVVTPSGRRLPLDRDRLYAATNYIVQSTARDVLCQALINLDEAGLMDYVLLPVHDEVIGSAPEEDAEEIAQEIGRTMEMDFHGVRLESEAEVYGPSWGHGYGAAA